MNMAIGKIYTEMLTDGVMLLKMEQDAKPICLREVQSRFAFMTALLLIKAKSIGLEFTFGESYDDDNIGHMKGSLHYIRLAQDLNLFKDGKFLSSTEDHKELGLWWESIGGSWGGRFNDGNHYSLAYGGKK
jgi:hypothetical protein